MLKNIKCYLFISIFLVFAMAGYASANTSPYQELDNGFLVNFNNWEGNINVNIKWPTTYQENSILHSKTGTYETQKTANCYEKPFLQDRECQAAIMNAKPNAKYYFKIQEGELLPETYDNFLYIPSIINNEEISIETTKSSAIVEWISEDSLNSKVYYYRINSSADNDTIHGFNPVNEHHIEILGLNADTDYKLFTTSIDGEGRGIISNGIIFTTQSGSICSDTDGGRIYTEKGTVNFENRDANNWNIDDCVIRNDDYTYQPVTSCSGERCELREKFCWPDSINVESEYIKCPEGCNNGACEQIVEKRCSDSDGGLDIYSPGKISVGNDYRFDDFCKHYNTTLVEGYCTDDGFVYKNENCKYGCIDGACVIEESDNNENSDNADTPDPTVSHNASSTNDKAAKDEEEADTNNENNFNSDEGKNNEAGNSNNDIFKNEAEMLINEERPQFTETREVRDIEKELETKLKYLEELKAELELLLDKVETALNIFITYGVDDNTNKLGAGERAAVVYSYKAAFNKLPEDEEELADAIKIASGRWPNKKSEQAEKKAKTHFRKIYKRIANMNNPSDNAAITVMAYGLRQRAENRNLNSENQGINTFKQIYGHHPSTTEDWNIMQAITYSGAARGKDTDGDFLTDDREVELGTDPNNPDSDGDGYFDGIEVENYYDPSTPKTK